MDDARLTETTIASHLIHTGRYLSVRVDTVLDADGGEHSRDVVDHPGAVAILALDAGEVLMVHQYRTPAGRVLLEIPAGTLERDATGATEEPLGAARRELGEETGVVAGDWRHLVSFFTAPGFATEHMHLYLATGISPLDGYAGPEEDERLRVERMAWRDAVDLALAGGIADAKTLVALLWLDRLVATGALDPGEPAR